MKEPKDFVWFRCGEQVSDGQKGEHIEEDEDGNGEEDVS